MGFGDLGHSSGLERESEQYSLVEKVVAEGEE